MALPKAIGRYEILGEVGAGGMAEVLLGRVSGPSGFERPVVVKRILPHLARQERFVAMFLDEARIVARIQHPNVVHVQELGVDEGELYLVMEYLEGESAAGLVKRLVARGRKLGPTLAAHVVAEACAGLHAAHELTDADGQPQGLVHRDVSPHNVFVTYQGQVKVIDFGVAKAQDRMARTEAGQVKGKWEYMAPEQCLGKEIDRRADVFALGILLYELGTMHRLFRRFNEFLAVKAITKEPMVPPSRVTPDFPPRLEAVCMRALARRPADRYATALDMRRDLLAAVRETASTTEAPALEPVEALAALMGEVFADRIDEKRELLRRVRRDTDVGAVPAGETDVEIDVPCYEDGQGSSGTETSSSVDAASPAATPRLRRWAVVGSVVGVGALIAGATLVRGLAGPSRLEASPPAAPATVTATEPGASSSAAAPPTAAEDPPATPAPAATATLARPALPLRVHHRLRPASPPPASEAPAPSAPSAAPSASAGYHRFN